MYKDFFNGFELVIFDLDGTTVKSEFAWDESLEEVFLPEIISPNPYLGERGQDIRSKIYAILKRNTFRTNVSDIAYYELVINKFFNKTDLITITPGFEEFVTFLKSKGIKTALVTNSDSRVTSQILEKKGLKKYFDIVLTSDDVVLPKPAPQIFYLTVEKFKIKKDKVLVFEDSVNGAIATDNAELKTIILLPDTHSPTDYPPRHKIFIENFDVINEDLKQDTDSFLEEFFNN